MIQGLSDEEILRGAWRASFFSFTTKAAGDRWQAYRWLVYAMLVLERAILEGNHVIFIEAPPRHGKTYTLSKWLATWFLELFPHKKVMASSYAAGLAGDISQFVRDEFISNAHLLTSVDMGNSARNDWRTTDGGGMRSAGVGGTATGFGFDLGIIDDPYKDWAEANSPAKRKAVIDFYDSVFARRAEPGATQIITHTRWHKLDLIGELMGRKWRGKKVIRLRFPAFAESNDLLGRDLGEPLCPERYSVDDLEAIKEQLSSMIWAAMYQQRPSPEDGNYFKRDWIKFYDKLPDYFDRIIHSWDCNFKKTTSGSFACGTVWGEHKTDKYLLALVRDRMSYTELRAEVKSLATRWPEYHEILVEDAANGPAIISDLGEEVPRIIPIKAKDSKEARAAASTVDFESGHVHLPNPAIMPTVGDYIEELVLFPNGEANDQVDSTTQALIRLRRSGVVLPRLNLSVGTQDAPFRL